MYKYVHSMGKIKIHSYTCVLHYSFYPNLLKISQHCALGVSRLSQPKLEYRYQL